MRNGFYLAAGIIVGLAAIVHGVGGELVNIAALLNTTLASNTLVELRAVWHGYTLILAGSAYILLAHTFGRRFSSDLMLALMLFYSIGGVIWLVVVFLMGTENLLLTPQWILLLAIGGLIEFGRRQSLPKMVANTEEIL